MGGSKTQGQNSLGKRESTGIQFRLHGIFSAQKMGAKCGTNEKFMGGSKKRPGKAEIKVQKSRVLLFPDA